MRDVPLLAGGPLSDYRLVIRRFRDQRPPTARRVAAGAGLARVEVEGKSWYTTSDDRFQLGGSLASAVTEVIARHLRAAELFRNVEVSEADPAPGDFVLTGDLLELEGRREDRDVSETLVAMNGLLGLALKATQHAELRGTTKLGQVQLMQATTKNVVWQGGVEGNITEEVNLNVVAAEQQPFDAANRSLRAAVDQLVRDLRDVSVRAALAMP
jgi:hypothetical protein